MRASKIDVVAQPADARAVYRHMLDVMTIGSPPLPARMLADWLSRTWITGREVLPNDERERVKHIAFVLSTYLPGTLPITRSLLFDNYPLPPDATERLDEAVGWRYSNDTRLPRVIYVENKFKNGYAGTHLASTAHVNFRRSISNSNVISGTYFYFDEFFLKTGRTIWRDILSFVETNGCDVLVLHVGGNKKVMDTLLPSHDDARQLKRLGAKIVLFGSDFIYSAYREAVERQLGHLGDWYLSIDIPPFAAEELDFARSFGKPMIGGWPPQDIDLYDGIRAPRDIGVGFHGNLHAYPDRLPGIDYLSRRGIPVHHNEVNVRVPHDEYISLLKRSLVTINFTSVNHTAIDPVLGGNRHIKARVFEAMAAGSTVLESDSGYGRRYFTDMEDVVFYKDIEDAREKIEFLLKNRDVTERIGNAARERIARDYDINAFWRHVLKALDIATGIPR